MGAKDKHGVGPAVRLDQGRARSRLSAPAADKLVLSRMGLLWEARPPGRAEPQTGWRHGLGGMGSYCIKAALPFPDHQLLQLLLPLGLPPEERKERHWAAHGVKAGLGPSLGSDALSEPQLPQNG